MSTEPQEPTMAGTQPVPEHEWLRQLEGAWRTESEMTVPGTGSVRGEGNETVTMLGSLWAFAEGSGTMPGGGTMHYRSGLGFDVSSLEYRGFWIADVSSHLWIYHCELSEDGRKMTMNCAGPHMVRDGETALYRDEIEILDGNRRTLTSYGQDDQGDWHVFVQATYTRV
jgi:hypothetical protein